LHVQGVSTLGENITVEALCDDGVVEAISVKDSPGFAVGVQCHLEWQEEDGPWTNALAKSFWRLARIVTYPARIPLSADYA
tara:strand:- start:342 stop:584 length:243 start_codon:yes stop_codon:yes gene_type:complete